MDITFHNVVASSKLEEGLNLEELALKWEGSQYEEKEFPGLVIKFERPKAAVMLFSSGNVVCSGCNSLEEAKETINRTAKRLRDLGLEVDSNPEVTFQNMVAFTDTGKDIDLQELAMSLGPENVSYGDKEAKNPMIYTHSNGVRFEFHNNGKVLASDSSEPEELSETMEEVVNEHILKKG